MTVKPYCIHLLFQNALRNNRCPTATQNYIRTKPEKTPSNTFLRYLDHNYCTFNKQYQRRLPVLLVPVPPPRLDRDV